MSASEACPGLWSLEDYDILLLPSITVSFYETRKLSSIHEERHLVMLNLLKNHNSRIIFVTSTPLNEEIIKYRLNIVAHNYNDPTAKDRLIVLHANDDSMRPLTDKILENEELMDRIRKNIRNPEKAIMLSYICTERDMELRDKLGIPHWFGSLSSEFGTKSGSRQIFQESGVPIAKGLLEPVYKLKEVEMEIAKLLPEISSKRIMMKMDDGSGGNGNYVLDFSSFDSKKISPEDIERTLKKGVEKQLPFDQFLKVVEESGIIVEEMFDPPTTSSLMQTTPSVQLFISDVNKVDTLSSHEQVMSGCVYIGCRYPAKQSYLQSILKYSKEVGKTLSRKGVRGFFGVDYLATQKGNREWDIIALEINLRLCATTFAFFTLLSAVRDETEVEKKHYMILDEMHMRPDCVFKDLETELTCANLQYTPKSGKGVIFATGSRLDSVHEASPMIIADSQKEVDSLLREFSAKFGDPEHPIKSLSISVTIPNPNAEMSTDKVGDAEIIIEEKKGIDRGRERMFNEQGQIV